MRFGYTRRVFRHIRKTNLATLAGVVLLAVSHPFLYWYVLPTEAWNWAVGVATAGLIEADLLIYIFPTCLVIIFLRTAGGLRPRDLGLTSQLPRAVLFTALLWALTQAALAVWQLSTMGQISWNDAWREPGATFVLGPLISQVFGNALFEETVWRGFIFVQLFLLLEQRKVKRALLKALLISQGLFALMHIPLQLIKFNVSGFSLLFWLLATGIAGVIFAVVYVKTGNLFVAVGFHAVFNEPTQLFAPPIDPSQIPATMVTLLGFALIFLPHVKRLWQEEVFFTSRKTTRI